MPTYSSTRNRNELSPEITALLKEMVIPSFQSLRGGRVTDEIMGDISFKDLGNTPPEIDNLPPLEYDIKDTLTSSGRTIDRTKRRVLATRREVCFYHPLKYDESYEEYLKKRALLSQICAAPECHVFDSYQYSGKFKREGFKKNCQNSWKNCRIVSQEGKTVDQPLIMYNLHEIPLVYQKPRLARANSEYLRMFALQNLMCLNGKLTAITAPIVLEPKTKSLESEECFGIRPRLSSEKAHLWSRITCHEH